MVQEIQAILSFWQTFENFKSLTFLKRGKFFAQIPCRSKLLPKSFYTAWFRRYKQFEVFPFLSKIRKLKMAAIFGKRKIFLKIEQSILHIYPTGQKFRWNHSILHGLGDISNVKFYHFVQNAKIQNGRHFWKENFFLRIEPSMLYIYPADQKFRRSRSI